jgi:hypothetical protein
LVIHPMTGLWEHCLDSAIADRTPSALTAGPSSSSRTITKSLPVVYPYVNF